MDFKVLEKLNYKFKFFLLIKPILIFIKTVLGAALESSKTPVTGRLKET